VIIVHEFDLPHFRADHVNGVTVFRILVKEIRDPDGAIAVFRGVSAMARRMVPAFILIDLSQTKHLSGMAFIVLSSLAQQVAATQGRLAICRLDRTLRAGADLMGISSGVDIYDDEVSALASFRWCSA
jgi:anti-anti-sigma regulatory factor